MQKTTRCSFWKTSGSVCLLCRKNYNSAVAFQVVFQFVFQHILHTRRPVSGFPVTFAVVFQSWQCFPSPAYLQLKRFASPTPSHSFLCWAHQLSWLRGDWRKPMFAGKSHRQFDSESLLFDFKLFRIFKLNLDCNYNFQVDFLSIVMTLGENGASQCSRGNLSIYAETDRLWIFVISN